MDASLEKLIENYRAILRDLEGKKVVKYIAPSRESGVNHGSLLFENGTVLEIGIAIIPSRRGEIDYKRESKDAIDSFDSYTIDELRERLGEETNLCRRAYYQNILEIFESLEQS